MNIALICADSDLWAFGTRLISSVLKRAGHFHAADSAGIGFGGVFGRGIGLKYREHAWKQRNLYLNGLLFLTEGKATKRRLGLLPRSMIPFLARPGVVLKEEIHVAFGY